MADLVPHIYHERQEPGSMLCGQHALNNLLQSSLFTPQDLADIARQLDAMEASALDPGTRLKGEGGGWGDGGGESQNYDDSGFFSVQVMEEALQVLGLRLVRWGSKEMESLHNTPEFIEGFLLNHQLHWYSLRRFGTTERFYNLDSCAKSPVWVSSMYLGLTLREAENQGYSIFAVLPLPESYISGLPACEAADKALNLPPPHGNGAASSSSSNGFSSFGGQGHSLSSASSSFQPAPNPFSALQPSLSHTSSYASTSSRKGKRPAAPDDDLMLSSGGEDDDDIIIEEPGASGAMSSGSSEGRRQRRRLEGEVGGGGMGGGGAGATRELSEEELMAKAIEESLRVSGDAVSGGGAGASGSGPTPTQQPPLSRAALSEEAEFERAIQASLAAAGQQGVEINEEDHDAQEDSPTMEELRMRRLARFG